MTKEVSKNDRPAPENFKGIVVDGPRTKLIVENIKCDGCARTISKALTEIGYKNITVHPEESLVELDSPQKSNAIAEAINKLRELGYPLIETEDGLAAVALKAKSYLSCAIGKMS